MSAEICRICLENNNETIFIFSQYLNEFDIVELVFEVASLKVIFFLQILALLLCTKHRKA